MIKHWIEKTRLRLRHFKNYFHRQSNIRKSLIVGFLFIGVPVVVLLILFLMVWSGALGHLPDAAELRSVQNPVSTEVYSADSVLLGRYFIQERSDIRYEDLPPHVIQALVATEDARFYSHRGIDYKSFVRVLIKSILLQHESSGGGSTITQQLAKNLFPRKSYWVLSLPINKFREMIVAHRLENTYDKNALITLYLNTIPFGDNTYGIESASLRFFNIHARELNIQQGAVLVGMLKATYTYNPRVFPDRSLQRRNVVLAQMKKYSKLASATCDSLQRQPLALTYNKITHHEGPAPYFRDFLREDLMAWCSTHINEDGEPYNLYTDGLKIYTTINYRLQEEAEKAMQTQMETLQKKFESHWSKHAPWDSNPAVLRDAIRRSRRYKQAQQAGWDDAAIDKMMKTPVMMNVFTWQGEQEVNMSPLDSIKHYLAFLNAGVLAIDPRQGAVRAWVGGINHTFFQYDHVRTSTKRQVGSTFKPIVYAAALEHGVDPCDFISAEKTIYTNVNEWTPANAEEVNYDRKYSMAGALAYSVNTVSVKMLEKAGIQNTIALAKKMGVSTDLPAVPSLALGVADLSMTELVTAYACFANNGKVVTPYYLTAIANKHGKLLERFSNDTPEPALSAENAQLMLHMLQRTVDEGTGARLRTQYGVTVDVAGKTGTTQSNADGWFVAITPRLVIGAWVGADDPRIHFRTTSLGQGAATALPIVGKLMNKMQSDQTLQSMLQSFPPLSPSQERQLSCALYKSDKSFFERIFGKKEKEQRRAFGAKETRKKGWFKRLFEND